MKRKLLVFAAVMVMLIAALCATAFAAEVVASGTCGENLTWTLDSDGLLTISGEGEMWDDPWNLEHREDIKQVIISDGVTTIDSNAFSECTSLTSVIMSDSITDIRLAAFMGCESLTNLTMSKNVTRIGSWAFFGTSLRTFTIPASLQGIGEDALFIPTLEMFYVDENNPYYSSDSYGILYDKDKTAVYQAPSAISYCEIPDSVTGITGRAFAYCDNLESISIPHNVTYIGGYAFCGCSSLKSVTIPASLEEINYRAFIYCESLTDVYYNGSEEQWNEIKVDADNEPLTNATIHFNYNPSRPQGDIDGNGQVENSDLVTIARYIVGLTEGNTKTAVEAYADMNGDGKVDNSDIVTVARKIVGLA